MGVHYNKADFITYGRPSLFLDFANKKSLTDRISGNNLLTFTRTSTGTYVGADGLIKSATTNEPRFDHNPVTGESLGLLIEEQRTNRITYSENFTNWVKSNITEQYEVLDGPVGRTTYSKFTLTQFTNSNGFLRGAAIGAVSDNQIFSGSIYLKKGTCRYAIVFIIPKSTNWQGSYFDLETGVMYKNDGSLSFSSTDVGNGWFRYHITVDMVTGGAGTMTMGVLPLSVQFPTEGPSNNIQPLFTSGEESLYAWGGQMELGSFPTSYIPTTDSQVTRNADSASITGSNLTSFYNQTQGTLFCRFRNFGYGDAYHAGGGGVSFDNSGPARPLLNLISLNMRRDGPFYRNGALIVANNTTFTDSLTTSGSSNNISDTVNYYNFVGSFSPSRRVFTYNGLTPGVNATTIDMPTISRFLISTNSNYLYDPFTGYISKISYYPSQLTDAQLQNLTK